MTSTRPPLQAGEHQPLPADQETLHTDTSLIQSAGSASEQRRSGYYTDPMFGGSNENPYGDTTESEVKLRHIPLSDIIPRPWRSYRQIEIASYVSVVLFLLTGIFAVKFTRHGRMHQSKGLMGMAQRDLLLATRLIYASICFGFFLYFIIIPIAAS